MKKFAIILISLLLFAGISFGAKTELSNIVSEVNTNRQPNGKYKRQDKKVVNGVEYEVHEYETSKGEIGYTIFITKEDKGMVYRKAISSGVEKTNREFDWQFIKDNTASST